MGAFIDLSGFRFGRLVVCGRDNSRLPSFGHMYWICLCDCGAIVSKIGHSLKQGNTKSCGCLRRETRPTLTHGHARKQANTKTYRCWTNAKSRCTNRKNNAFKRYGGKGIKMCERWLNSFENFLSDMGEAPPNKSLDRYPIRNGNYEPENCRWATPKEQSANSSVPYAIEWNGKIRSIKEIAGLEDVPHQYLGFSFRALGDIDAAVKQVKAAMQRPARH